MRNLSFILLFGALAAGCSKETPLDTPPVGGTADRVPVTLRVGEIPGGEVSTEVSTRAPLGGFYNTEVWMAYGESATAESTTFNNFTTVLDGFVGSNITVFRPLLFYPENGKSIFLRGVYPREGITNLGANGEIVGDRIEYTITGQEDIMISNMLSGKETAPIGDDEFLTYGHLLTQLSLYLSNSDEDYFPSTLRVTSVRVRNVSRNAVLELDPELYPDYNSPGILTFTDPPTSALKVYDNPAGMEVVESSRLVGSVMFRPGEAFDLELTFNTGDVVEIKEIRTTSSPVKDISEVNGTSMGVRYNVYITLSTAGFRPTITGAWVEQPTGIDVENWW